MSEGSAMQTDPHHTPTIIQPSTSPPQKKQRPRNSKRKDTEIPQSSGPTTNVADEAVNEEIDDNLVRAATTASSLEAEHDSVKSSDEEGFGEEDASKQGRIADIDADAEINLVNTHIDADAEINLVSTHFDVDTAMFGVHDLVGDEVVVESEVAVKAASTIPVSVATTTTTIITNDEITLAKALAKLKSDKLPTTTTAIIVTTASTRPTAKGLVIHEEEQAMET
ncbi:hypothetical protein Tco_0927208, partial [Tanacetum coccineum]